MQSWPNSGQNGADEQSHQHQWQPNFAFNGQNGQFDHQPWSQSMADQTTYSQITAQDATSNFFDPAPQGSSFLTGNLHAPSPSQPFHAGHDSLALNQQFSQAPQDAIDPSFSDIHSDMYAQQGKMNLGDSIGHMSQVQNHAHAHPQNFQYSFAQQGEPSYESPIQSFAQPHVMAPTTRQQARQQTRQQSHTPVQQFEGLQTPDFAPNHTFSRPPQHSPVPNQQNYGQNSAFSPPVNGQASQPQATSQSNYQQPLQQQQQQQQQQRQQPFSQSQPQPLTRTPTPTQYVAQDSLAFQQPPQAQGVQNQGFQPPSHQQPMHQKTGQFATNSASPPTSNVQYMQNSVEDGPTVQPGANEPPAKKRKRVLAKSTPEAHTPEPTVAHADSPLDTGLVANTPTKKVDDVDSLVVPTPSPEELHVIAQFNKRSKAAQVKQPPIKGLPFLVYDPSTKLPAPKSYDKLAPMVALPSRSGKHMVPELGYSLPCEVQGRFSSQYRPSPDKGGLDERRLESKYVLDEFDRSMKALGKRRPKYTEYPHAFKEQLKSDEASKNKAEKKAKKEQEEERNKPIRAATRPADPAEAAAWDAVGIVHIDQSTSRASSLIAGRVQQAGDFFIKLRGEMNRAKQDLDQAVKDKLPEAEIARRRQDFEQKKEILYRALDSTIEHADDAVMDNLGGHQKLVLSLINALIMCIKTSDFSGKLPKIVLELFTHFPMTKKIAETTNFETVRKRFADKGDSEVKDLVRDISVKVKKVLKDHEAASGYTGTSAASRARSTGKSSTDHSAKRSRDDESDTRVVKKIAMDSGGNSLSKKLAQPKIQLQSASKTTAAKAAAASILPGKSRLMAKSAPKPETTKADAKATVEDKARDVKTPSRPETKVPLPKTVSSSSSVSSGIASLLDSINAPKAQAAAMASKDRDDDGSDSSETPEEKSKRLRKEARKKLRVSWKADAELVQVKIFQKEESEDEGRENSMIRDAGDDRSEGMVLKQRAIVDDDDDDDDIPYQPWSEPTATSFANLAEETRNKNFVTRGGSVQFTTDEQQRIADREQGVLMALYTSFEDIPSTPKSPPPELAEGADIKSHPLPSDGAKFQEVHSRWRDAQQGGLNAVLYNATQRLDGKEHPSNKIDSILGRLRGTSSTSQPSSSVPAPASAPKQPKAGALYENIPLLTGQASEEQIVVLLGSERVKNWQDPNPSHSDPSRVYHYTESMVRLCGMAIETVAKSLAGQPFPASSPPEWIRHDAERVREWHLAHNKEVAAKQKLAEAKAARADATGIGAATTKANGGQGGSAQDWAAYYSQQQMAPYMALLQQMTGGQQGQQQAQIPDSQLQSILAAINQPAAQAPLPQVPSAASFLNPTDTTYQQYMMLAQRAGQQAPPPPPPPAAEREWDRDRSHGHHRDRDRNDHQGGGRGDQREGKRKRGTLPPHKPANKALIGTKPCSFWQQGKCARDKQCTFRHD